MNETYNQKATTILNALVDLGTAWAAHGLDAGKMSLENSAKILTKTAERLETLSRDLQAKKADGQAHESV